MNSSTSSSDPAPAQDAAAKDTAAWRRFLRLLLGVAVPGLAVLVAALVALDPYDSGRLTPWPHAGAPRTGQRLSHASRGRDPAFDSAIIGNSHMQLLSPERLRQRTGLAPVSLVVPASGVQEQMAILGWFLRHRATPPRAVIIGVDNYTCAAGTNPLQTHGFPFWLYGTSDWHYVGGLLSTQAVNHASQRLRARLRGGPFGRPDGFDDYDSVPETRFDPGPHPAMRPLASTPGPFPALDLLARQLASLPAGTALILVVPPVFAPTLPASGSAAAQADAACLRALREMIAGRPASTVLNFRTDTPMTRDPALFRDVEHYRHGMAEMMEAAIGAWWRQR